MSGFSRCLKQVLRGWPSPSSYCQRPPPLDCSHPPTPPLPEGSSDTLGADAGKGSHPLISRGPGRYRQDRCQREGGLSREGAADLSSLKINSRKANLPQLTCHSDPALARFNHHTGTSVITSTYAVFNFPRSSFCLELSD